MIREKDLLDAIAECQGERNPTASTCIKLAAYYTILNNMSPVDNGRNVGYSYSGDMTDVVNYRSGTEFSEYVSGLHVNDVMVVMDELMEAIHVLSPRMYYATLDRFRR